MYAVLQDYNGQFPPVAQRVLGYMQTHDWLTNYQYAEGIRQTLSGMQRRAKFPNQMGQAANGLTENESLYVQEFDTFFPQLQQHVDRF